MFPLILLTNPPQLKMQCWRASAWKGCEAVALMGAVQAVDPPGKHTDRLPEDVGEAKGQWEFRRLETVAVPLLEAELAEWASYERLESNGLGSSRVVRKVHRSGVDLCLQERMARSGPIGVEVAFRGSLKRVEFVASLEPRSVAYWVN